MRCSLEKMDQKKGGGGEGGKQCSCIRVSVCDKD